MGAELVLQSIDALAHGQSTAIEQDPALASSAPRLKKTDGLIEWARSATAIRNQVRAMAPWPKAYTFYRRGGGEPMRLILEQVSQVNCNTSAPPGAVHEASGDELLVATGDGVLRIDRLQPAGKRVLTASEFLRGYPMQPGDQLESGTG